jgi:hypothetical protein
MFLLMLIVLVIGVCPARAAAQDIDSSLFLVRDALSEWFARTQPLPSASAGVSYSFDPATGNFRRDPATFGQIYVERADPLGAKHFNVSVAYQYTKLEQIEGHDADNLHDDFPFLVHDEESGLDVYVQIPRLSIHAEVHSVMFAATYGFNDDLDASIAVPLMISDLRFAADLAAASAPNLDLVLVEQRVSESTEPVGVGDVLLRVKYRWLELDAIHAAANLLLRLPAGDKDDLQGTGFVEVAPSLLASSRIFEPRSWARFQGHFNATIGFNADDVDSSDARWGIGLDWGITEEITAAVALLGRHPFSRIGSKGAFDFPRCNANLITCAVDMLPADTEAPLFGITGDRVDYYTMSIGARAGLWRDTIFGFVNVAIPLDDGFVRTAPIPMIGIEATL